jgi:hemerythrin superfamily protein
MTTPRTGATKSGARSTTVAPRAPDAISLLKADHRTVEKLFDEYENASRKDRKFKIAMQICEELTLHALVEEQGFYPPAKAALGEDADLVSEATVEHASLKWLIEQLQSEDVESELYDSKVKVLQEYVSHHVKEEEKEMFPKLKKTDLDLVNLGADLMTLKEKLKKSAAH